MTAAERESVGIFGGSFNPPHLAHLVVAEVIRDQFDLDRILWIPNHQNPLKDSAELAAPEHRFEMTRLATAGHPAFGVSDVEISRAGKSYTIDTIRTLRKENPHASHYLIVGSDSLAGLDRWHEPKALLRLVPFIVFPREGSIHAAAPEDQADRVAFVDAPLLDISSTAIRRRLRDDMTIRYMVPDAVGDYIRSEGLYR